MPAPVGRRVLARILRVTPDPPRLAPTLNRAIDRVLHPLAREYGRGVYVIDTLLHWAVEAADSAAASLAKTLRYNAPRILGLEDEE